MDSAELFTRAVTSLPEAVRRRLDGGEALDWTTLADPGTGVALGEASVAHRRLPEPVELLVRRLIRDVGIVPDDVAAGIEREGSASAWLRRVALEADGESYRLQDRLGRRVHAGVRPEAVAGYALLALELARIVHETGEGWLAAGERYRSAADDESGRLARCAIWVSARLRSRFGSDLDRRATGDLADALENAWNSQTVEMRAELATSVRLSTARGARAPRERRFAPMSGYRLHACDLGEIRWLRALAERAGVGAPAREQIDAPPGRAAGANASAETIAGAVAALAARTRQGTEPGRAVGSDSDPEELALGRELADLERVASRFGGTRPPAQTARGSDPGDGAASLDMTALAAQIQSETESTLDFGPDADERTLDRELAELGRAASQLPGAVRRRLGESHGIGVTQALARLQDPQETAAAIAELSVPGRRAPRWLEDLAAALLADTGARAGDGLRTGSLRLDPEEEPDAGYLATEQGTGNHGRLTPLALVAQMHPGLSFALGAWAGLTALGKASKEGGWILEGDAGDAGLSPGEREMLEAAGQIGRALDRVRGPHASSPREPSALEQAAMAADALAAVGPAVRAAAGWPGGIETPNPRNPEDVTRIAAVAGALYEDVRSISNRLIADRMKSLAAPGGKGEA